MRLFLLLISIYGIWVNCCCQDSKLNSLLIPTQFNQIDGFDLGTAGSLRNSVLFIDTSLQDSGFEYLRIADTVQTEVNYIFGTGNDQFFSVAHKQKFSNSIGTTIFFQKVLSEGIYLHQAISKSALNVSVVGSYSNYKVMLEYNSDNYITEENGGIAADSSFINNEFDNRLLYAVRLEDAVQSNYKQNYNLTQSYDLGKDTLSDLWLFHTANYLGSKWTFEDGNPVSGYYLNVFEDTLRTTDYWTNELFSNSIALNYEQANLEWQISGNYDIIRINSIGYDSIYSDAFVTASFSHNYSNILRFNSFGHFFVAGYRVDDVLVNADLAMVTNWGRVRITGQYSSTEPDLWYQEYSSNHFYWRNDFAKERQLLSSFSVKMDRINSIFKLGYALNYNLIYLDENATPKQFQSGIGAGFAEWSGKLKKNIYVFDTRTLFQLTSQYDIVKLPSFYSVTSLYVEDSLFHQSMHIKVGLSVRYWSKFEMNNYMPALGKYHIQNNATIGNYPYLDFFLDANIHEATFQIRVSHVNAGFMGYEYFAAPHYPSRDLGFYLGIKWRFTG